MGSFQPRLLRAEERALLESALDALGPEGTRYRDQVPRLVVLRVCECGCGTVDLGIEGEERVPGTGRFLICGGWREGSPPVEVILFASGTRLTSLEIVPNGDQPPARYPSPKDVVW